MKKLQRYTKLASFSVAALSLALFVSVAPVQAQVPGAPSMKPKIYLGGGVAPLSNPSLVKDFFNSNYSLMAAIGLPLNIGFEPILKLHYHKQTLKDEIVALGVISSFDRRFLTIGLDMKWSLAPPMSPAKPFLLIGGGNFSLKQDVATTLTLGTETLPLSASETGFYFNIGAGMDISVGPTFAFFVEGKYTVLVTNPDANGIMPLIFGVRVF